jgi:hypothetical protein
LIDCSFSRVDENVDAKPRHKKRLENFDILSGHYLRLRVPARSHVDVQSPPAGTDQRTLPLVRSHGIERP